jgi:hypothetical protein
MSGLPRAVPFILDPAHLADFTAPCSQCGAVWVTEPDGSGTMNHADTCTYIAGIDPAHPQYGPDWVAACYGVTVNDPCPVITLPSAVTAAEADAVIAASLARFARASIAGRMDRVTGRPATIYTPPEDIVDFTRIPECGE